MHFRHMLVALYLSLSFPLAGQQTSTDCGCNAALAKDMRSIVRTVKQQEAFLSEIDEKTFHEYKRDLNLVANIPIAKKLLEASASYSDFVRNRTDYFARQQSAMTHEEAYKELSLVTASVAYVHWSACMEGCAVSNQKAAGLFVWKENDAHDAITLKVYYKAPPKAEAAAPISGDLLGGVVDGARPGRVFPPKKTIDANGYASAIIKRQPGKAIRATITAAGYVESIYSDWGTLVPSAKATLRLERPAFVDTRVGEKCARTDWTYHNHMMKCNKQFHWSCDPSGQYAANTVGVALTADAGHVLQNLKSTKCITFMVAGPQPYQIRWHVENGPGCAPDNWRPEALVISGDGKTAAGVFRGWSHAVQFEACADHVRRDTQNSVEERTVEIPTSGTFTFTVPTGFSSAVLQYEVNGVKGVFRPGDQISRDGVFELINFEPSQNGSDNYFQYRVVKQGGHH